jgi:glycosyl transferase family 87
VTPRLRLAWFAAVAFVALIGLGNLSIWILDSVTGHSWWAIDLQLVLDAGSRYRSGAPLYADPKFLYPPLAAVVGAPLSGLDPVALSLAWAAAKVAMAVAGALALTRSMGRFARGLAVVGIVTCLPFLHDLWLGNVNALLVAAIALAVVGAPTWPKGIALGLVAAVFAKPLLVPVLLWLLVTRRPVFAGAVVAGLAATAVGLLLAGPAAYVDWVQALFSGQTRYASDFAGNHGVSALAPQLWIPVAAAAGIAFLVVLWRRGPAVSFAWAVSVGILVAPYAGTYSALPMALALPVIGPALPVVTLLLVGLSPFGTTFLLPFWAAAVLVAALFVRDARGGGSWSLRTP